jgi:hypothetical protein
MGELYVLRDFYPSMKVGTPFSKTGMYRLIIKDFHRAELREESLHIHLNNRALFF